MPGYKQTEIGMLPNDWEAKSLGEHATFRTGPFGSALHKSDYVKDGVPVVNPMHIIDGEIVPTAAMTITESAAQSLAEFRLREGEIIIGRRGDMGRCAVVKPHQSGWLCGTGSMIVRPLGVDAHFLQRVLSSHAVISAIVNNSVGTTMVNLNQSSLSSLKVQYPPSTEQSAIATTLSDVDALLAAQDALIAKKRAIKEGVMQELLAGKRRLPGFSGEWEVKRLGDHLQFLSNGANSRAELVRGGRVRYLHYGDIHGSNKVLLDPTITAMPFLPEMKAARLDRLKDGDLIFADASEDLDGVGKSIELKNVGKLEVVSGMHTIAVRFDKSILADGFKAYLQAIPSFHRHLRRLASGTKVYATNMSHIASAEVALPDAKEQIAISEVVFDMDTELTALEAQRAKAAQLKQGMMQELLTGRIRLV